MGIGGGIVLIVIGAILTFALKVDVSWLDLQVIGVIFMVAGAAVVVFTVWFWNSRRRRGVATVVEEARLAHESGPVPPDSPDAELR